MCQGVFILNGRGTLVLERIASQSSVPHAHVFAITGGTGEFAGARGVLESPKAGEKSPGFVWTITLFD